MDEWASAGLRARAAYLRYLGTAACAEVREAPGVFAVRTGIVSNAENGVVSSGATAVTAEVAERLVGWFQESDLPASWMCADGPGRAATVAALEAVGARAERDAVEMCGPIRAILVNDEQPTGDLRVERVDDERRLAGWLNVAGACGWFETQGERFAMARLFGALCVTDAGPLHLHVAILGDTTVGMAGAFRDNGTLLLTSSAVLPAYRRRGIGRALATARLREARRRGCETVALSPTPDGARLYEALGLTMRPQPADRCVYLPLHSRAGRTEELRR